MKLETRWGTFSKFTNELWVRVSDGNVTFDVDIDYEELRAFALMLLDVADDALSKIGGDAENCQSMLRDCISKLQSDDWAAPEEEE